MNEVNRHPPFESSLNLHSSPLVSSENGITQTSYLEALYHILQQLNITRNLSEQLLTLFQQQLQAENEN